VSKYSSLNDELSILDKNITVNAALIFSTGKDRL